MIHRVIQRLHLVSRALSIRLKRLLPFPFFPIVVVLLALNEVWVRFLVLFFSLLSKCFFQPLSNINFRKSLRWRILFRRLLFCRSPFYAFFKPIDFLRGQTFIFLVSSFGGLILLLIIIPILFRLLDRVVKNNLIIEFIWLELLYFLSLIKH